MIKIKSLIIRPHLFLNIYGFKRKAVEGKGFMFDKNGVIKALHKLKVIKVFWVLE